MNNDSVERLKKQFGPLLPAEPKISVPDDRFDFLVQLLSDINNFMSRSPEYQVVVHKVREQKNNSIWVGWTLETKRQREKGHDEWLVYRLREIFGQYEWDSRYERVQQHLNHISEIRSGKYD